MNSRMLLSTGANSPSEGSAPSNPSRDKFREAATDLLQLYKDSVQAVEGSYAQGKEDAYEEMFRWFTTFNNSDFKHIPASEFFKFLQDRMQS